MEISYLLYLINVLDWNFSINIGTFEQQFVTFCESIHVYCMLKWVHLNMTQQHTHTHTEKDREFSQSITIIVVERGKLFVNINSPCLHDVHFNQQNKHMQLMIDVCIYAIFSLRPFISSSFFSPTNKNGKWNIKSDVSNL